MMFQRAYSACVCARCLRIFCLCLCAVLARAPASTHTHSHTHTNGVGEGRTGAGEEIEYLMLTRKEDVKEGKEAVEQVRGKGSG